jgi:predicted nuclease with TOPRIM domain
MAGEYDSTEFIDPDFPSQKSASGASAAGFARPAMPDDVNRKVMEAQQKLVELKRAQEELERQRAGLEELRRRQNEFQTGRDEVIQNLTRGLGLLEEAEFVARRDAEQMAKTVGDFRAALEKVQAIREEGWNKDNFQMELTRALTVIENARMEWNSARLKIAALAGETKTAAAPLDKSMPAASAALSLGELPFGQLCKIGLAMTWPLLIVALGALGVFIAILVRK